MEYGVVFFLETTYGVRGGVFFRDYLWSTG